MRPRSVSAHAGRRRRAWTRPPTGDSGAAAVAGYQPWMVVDVDVARGIPALPAPGQPPYQGAWVLVRAFEEPLGAFWLPFSKGAVEAAAIPSELRALIRDRLEGAGVPWDGQVPTDGCLPAGPPPFLADRDAAVVAGPSVTVVVCTRDRPDGLRRCLDSLQRQSYPGTALMVVENASTSPETRIVVEELEGPIPVEYFHEPKPGLAHARNRAVLEAGSDIIAWIDDDEVADPSWVAELVRGFALTPEAVVVCGVMVPAELETAPQVWFEEYGGHNKGRGFRPAVFSPATRADQSPLLPLPPFGTGGNMAVRRAAIEAIGGFDPALGAGTPAMGAEDTRALTDLLLSGGTIRYQPTAVTWHYHRRDLAGLERQLFGYGAGLGAFYTSLVLDRPLMLVDLVRLAPYAARQFRDRAGPRFGAISADFPPALLRAHRRGLLSGPAAYLRGRRRGRRTAWLQSP